MIDVGDDAKISNFFHLYLKLRRSIVERNKQIAKLVNLIVKIEGNWVSYFSKKDWGYTFKRVISLSNYDYDESEI